MRVTLLTAGIALSLLPGCSGANAPDRSIMPESRPAMERAQVSRSPGFEQWLDRFRPRALTQGVSAATLDRTFRTISYDEDAIRRDRAQAEFTRPIWQYLDGAVSDTRIENGTRALREHAGILAEIERRYGVPKEVVVAVWGLESSYGSSRGTTHVPSALATLAFDGRRGSFFESQLIGAMKIIQTGDVTPEGMRGSWAGAMGHTQFIPTSYLAYAVDFRGDGKRDIWSDDPTDGLASTAAYLAGHGWTTGQPWAIEVRLPSGFDPRAASQRRAVGEWRALGLQAVAGATLPALGQASLMFPAGAQGPALLAFGNFRTIKRYNNSDAYVIAVGNLSDRLRGAGPFVTPWPRTDRPLNSDERVDLQRLLTARGYDTGGVDGRVGPMTIEAVRNYQVAEGLTPDGYVSLDLLNRLRR